jgi:glyoxylase-like metal-dependent hydrolase (beta-lactamase superfamily II)
VGAIFELQARAGAPCSIHHADLLLYENLDTQAQWIGMSAPKSGAMDFVKDGDAVACTGVELGVIHTPGHTPGSSTFQLQADRPVLFTGDTLFHRSIGRTDLWGGSYPEIIRSINTKLMGFEDDTLVIAGHGPSTTIGQERRLNPFLR